jgi:exodeoxyribonuclease V alpha subunit
MIRGGTEKLAGELRVWNPVRNGWGHGFIELPTGERAKFNAVMTGVALGSSLELTGMWTDHPQHGRQFKARTAIARAPASLDGVTLWLASALPGVGAIRGPKLVEHFGGVEQLWHAIEHTPARLAEINGITAQLAERMVQAYAAQRGDRDNRIQLRGWGLTDKQIERCIEEWTTLDLVVAKVRGNPFELSSCVHGFGFKRADLVAKNTGLAHDAPERIEAGIVYTLDEASGNEGHCFMWGGQLQRKAAEDTLDVSFDTVAQGIRRAAATGLIARRGKRIYSARHENHERKCETALTMFLKKEAAANDNNVVSLAAHKRRAQG